MLIKVTPDREKARSILKMVRTSQEMILTIDSGRFPSNVTKEYYEIIRELMSVLVLLDGNETYGEGAHRDLIEYLKGEMSSQDISLIDELRTIRNKIAYDGFFVTADYISRKQSRILEIVGRLQTKIESKLKK